MEQVLRDIAVVLDGGLTWIVGTASSPVLQSVVVLVGAGLLLFMVARLQGEADFGLLFTRWLSRFLPPRAVHLITGVDPDEGYDAYTEEERAKAIELGVRVPVLRRFEDRLLRARIGDDIRPQKLLEMVEQYHHVAAPLKVLEARREGQEGAIVGQVAQARAALDDGDFTNAISIVRRIADTAAQAGEVEDSKARSLFDSAAEAHIAAGDMAMAAGDFANAMACFGRALIEIPVTQPRWRSSVLNKHGSAAYRAGKPMTAMAAFHEELSMLEELHGAGDPDVATALNNIGLLLFEQGDLSEAERRFRQALAIREKALEKDNPLIHATKENLAEVLTKAGRKADAAILLGRPPPQDKPVSPPAPEPAPKPVNA